MRFEIVSLRQISQRVAEPFEPQQVIAVDEYDCSLYRCEGATPLHRHVDHDELLWPLDHAIALRGEGAARRIPAGHLARVRRGWKHGSASDHGSYVLHISRAARSRALNGHHSSLHAAPQVGGSGLPRLRDHG